MCIFNRKEKYIKDGRLEDVLGLIQVLALDEESHRSESWLVTKLPAKPISSENWISLAKDHPEFFRVVDGKRFPVSLVARHVSEEKGTKRPPLTPEQTQSLLSTAIELHDRQIKRSQRWTVLIPIWVAVIGGIVVLVSGWFSK